ncbi:MAG: hypothetical protein E7671_03405 [Ruminococcaceae bacterium]|nr:hypothetical protein [Oscillospiraceae bacterium]
MKKKLLTEDEEKKKEESHPEEPFSKEESPKEEESELETLRRKNAELTSELEERKKLTQRLEGEIGEFSELFPDVSLSEVPSEVWDEVKRGIPLTASYSKHERKRILNEKKASEINNSARELSSGALGKSEEYYYTPDEVRKMSAAEVKKNYSHIISSMKRWN